MRRTDQTKNAVIVGIDPDATKVGVAMYDVATNEVLLMRSMHYNDIAAVLVEARLKHRDRLLVRCEMPERKTAYGASKCSGAKQAYNTAYSSGMCRMIALLVVDLCGRIGIRVEEIPSSKRTNIKNRPLSPGRFVSDLTGTRFFSWAKMQPIKTYPTKLSSHQAAVLFPEYPGGSHDNSETRDALLLMFPELVAYNVK